MKILALSALSALALCGAANADVSISSKPTSNMSCDAGVCTATAQKAVLNVADLQNMLGNGDVTVKTGSVAKDIDIDQPLTWSSTSRLTLDAQQSVTVKKQITVASQGALTVTTNDTGAGKAKNKTGEFIILPRHGNVQFWDLSSSLMIDGNSYTLVGDIKTLASDIANNPSGFYALAKPYDASVDGTYSATPVATPFTGMFEGLGNVISNVSGNESFEGLFHQLFVSVRDLGIANAVIDAADPQHCPSYIGTLSAINEVAIVENVWATGTITSRVSCVDAVGGLVGLNGGTIADAWVDMNIAGSETRELGGLAGFHDGVVDKSFAKGRIFNERYFDTYIGGLVGRSRGLISNSYSLMAVKCTHTNYMEAGGLVGANGDGIYPGGSVEFSYSAGRVHTTDEYTGGFAGESRGDVTASYWDIDTSEQSGGCGNGDCSDLHGLTDTQLKSTLPNGFDPKIWGQSPKINNGYPYLLANPPPK